MLTSPPTNLRSPDPASVQVPAPAVMLREYRKCQRSFAYFADRYCQVLSDAEGPAARWVPFRLWPEQLRIARFLQENRLVAVLKARQLGLTWLCLAFALWLMLFHPIATVLLFSKRDDEAVELLSVRLRGMYLWLPAWLHCRRIAKDNDHDLELSNGSRAKAFPTTAGDSYTASLAVCDEFDLCDSKDQERLMRAVKPTIDGGGRMVIVSRVDKGKPESTFKKLYRAAREQLTDWRAVFLPWFARPDRTPAWFARQRDDIVHRTGALDDLHEQYPATDTEALAPRSLDKRIHPTWLEACYRECPPVSVPANFDPQPPAIPGLVLYALPKLGGAYVVALDPAEGNPTSDDSALTVLDVQTGEEVAALAGKLQPAVLAGHADQVGRWYGRADIMVERNNHGHAVILWLRDHSNLRLLCGDDGKPGWLSSTLGKALLYEATAEAFRNGETLLHTFATFTQLSSIEGSSLRAPEGQADDRAVSYALACVARARQRRGGGDEDVPLELMSLG